MFEKSHEKEQVIIRSADTDVLVLALCYHKHMCNRAYLTALDTDRNRYSNARQTM